MRDVGWGWRQAGANPDKLLGLISPFSSFCFGLCTCSHLFLSLTLSLSPCQDQSVWLLWRSAPSPGLLQDQTKKKWEGLSLHQGVADNVDRLNTHTHTHANAPHVSVHSRPQLHVHTHTHNLPHPHIDIRIQKHTCQGLSTAWAKAKKSGPPSVSLYVVSHVCYIKANPFSSHFLIWNNGMRNFHI